MECRITSTTTDPMMCLSLVANQKKFSHRQGGSRAGMTLVEVLVAAAVSSLIMTGVMGLFFYSSRSFVALGNYVGLDGASRNAIDSMAREIRQASALTAVQTN